MKTIILFLFLSLNLFAQSSLLTLFDSETTATPPATYDTEAQAYFDAVTLSETRQDTIDMFIKMLKDSLSLTNLSDKFDAMGLLANTNETAALTNIVYPDTVGTNTGGTSFAVDRGYTGDDVAETKWVETGVTPSWQTNYSLNSASFGVYCRLDVTESKNMGATNGATSDRMEIYPRHGSGSVYASLNSSSYASGVVATGQGLTTIVRRSSTEQEVYHNSTSIAVDETDNTGKAIPPGYELFLLARNDAANESSASNFGTQQVAFWFLGEAFSDEEVRKINNCIEWLLDAIGAGVE